MLVGSTRLRGFRPRLLTYVLMGVFVVWGSFGSTPVKAATGINQQLNFQGRLLNQQGATVPDGNYNIQFKIYKDGDGQSVGNTTGSPAGTLLWTESHLNNSSQGVQVKNGFMSVQLGSITAFAGAVDWNQDTLWLSLNIGSTNLTCTPFSSCTPDGEMVPMKRLSSSPYAFNAGQLGGMTSSQFVQLAQGLQTDATTNPSVYINKTGGSGNLMTLQSSGSTVFQLSNGGDLTLGANADHTIAVAAAGAGVAGKDLTITAGASGSGGGLDGGDLVLQGGTGTGNTGAVIVRANTTDTTSVFRVEDAAQDTLLNIDSSNEIVSLGSGLTMSVPNFNTPTLTDTGGSIANATTYYYTITALSGATETEHSPVISYTVSSGTNTNKINLSWSEIYGATSYKIYRNTSNSFTSGSLLLNTIGSGSTTTYSDTGSSTSSGLPPASTYNPTLFRVDAAANNPFGSGQTDMLGSMYYNTTSGEFQCYKDAGDGGSWADCGVTTLQGAYNNATDPTEATIKLDSTHGALNIQDANSTIGTNLLNIRAGTGSGLGTTMFSVGNTGAVTIQNTSDQTTAARIMTSGGTYMFNVNTAAGFVINNGTQSIANSLPNPSFESGGSVTGGEQGWNGPGQASIVSSSANAHTGNYELQVAANTSTLKTYAGTYYSVTPDDVVYVEAWVKNSAGANGTGGVIIEGYDKDKSLIGSSSDASLPGTSYALKSTSYTVPSNVSYVRVAAIVNSGATTGTYYFDDFYMASSARGQQVFQNTSNSTSAFSIKSAAAGQTLLGANTTDNIIKIGDSTGTDTAMTMLVVDSATADPTTLTSRNGGLFYRSDTGSLKAVMSGSVYDICTTATVCSGYGASATSSVALQVSSPGTTQSGNFNITGTGILTQLQTLDQSAASTNSNTLTIRTGNATGSTSNSGNLVLDVGTATGTKGAITIGSSGVATTMPGTLEIQGASTLKLGTASSATGAIQFRTSAGANTVTVQAPGSNPTSAWTLVLPQNPGNAGECLKDSSGTGTLAFGGCDPGSAVSLQGAYDNSSSPATITLADNKNIKIVAQDTTTDPSIIFDLQCDTSCSTNGRFAVQDDGSDTFSVSSTGAITLGGTTQVGSSTTDATQTNLQLDSYNNSSDSGTCGASTNQGAMYYNTATGTIRACQGGSWGDLSNPDYLGLLSLGVIPSSGSNPYDLPSNVTAGVSGPCKVSWASSTSVSIEACSAYSGGKRVNVTATTLTTNSATTDNTNLTTANRWGHICLKTSDGQPAFTNTAGQSTALAAMPTFSVSAPILCLADVQGSSTSAGVIDNIYDVRTFSSTIKEAVSTSTASELGMLLDSGTGGSLVPSATCTTGTCSGKLYGVVVVTDGSTSTTAPNTIIATVGPGFVKATAGTAGQFIKSGPTAGYGETVAAIPNNAFYYSPGNTRTTWSTTCSAASNCLGSLYVNFIVR